MSKFSKLPTSRMTLPTGFFDPLVDDVFLLKHAGFKYGVRGWVEKHYPAANRIDPRGK